MPITRMYKVQSKTDENKNGNNFQENHHVVGFSRFTNAAHQDYGEQHHDQESGPVESEVPARPVKRIPLKVCQTSWKIGRNNPAKSGTNAEPVQQIDNVRGKSDADSHVGNGVLKD